MQNKPVVYPDTFFRLTERYRETMRQTKYLTDFHQRIIDERRELLKKNNNNNNINDSEKEESGGYNIFIDRILNNDGMFTDEDTFHHVLTVMSAGIVNI